jgi:hypothetical protein
LPARKRAGQPVHCKKFDTSAQTANSHPISDRIEPRLKQIIAQTQIQAGGYRRKALIVNEQLCDYLFSIWQEYNILAQTRKLEVELFAMEHGWLMKVKQWVGQATRLSRSATRRPERATISSTQANQPFMS